MENKVFCSTCKLGSCALYTLSGDELVSMASQTCQAKFRKGELIRKQDSPLDSVIYLKKGYVKEFMGHEQIADQVIQLIKPRSYIGLQGLFINTSSVFSYQAITEADVCFIDKSVFSDLIRGNGNFAREILICLSQETISTQQRFLSLNQSQVFGKVAGMLMYLSDEVYENVRFELQLTRTEMSQMVGSTRESVTRALLWYHNEGIIRMNKNWVTLLDKSRLKEIARKG